MTQQFSKIQSAADQLFKDRYFKECNRVNQIMIWLMLAQWIAGIAIALWYSPLTWIGQRYDIHIHVWAATFIGGSISAFSILWMRTFPNAAHTRHVVAATQMLWSALLIHLSGGRIETHFHFFGSLAILSIYRDWKILVTATVVVAIDHFVRGVYYPLSAFGIATETPYRWIEHAGWVLFEVGFLAPGCLRLRNEIRELCLRQAELTDAKATVDQQVLERTQELQTANTQLAEKTREAEKLALVARSTDNAVVITDQRGRIEWVNEAFTRINGFSLEEVAGKEFSEFRYGSKTDETFHEKLLEAFQDQTGYETEVVLYRKDGEHYWAEVDVCPIKDHEGKWSRLMSVERDITDRVKAEAEKQKLNERLLYASRSAGKAEVATGILHNVGNILNSVNVSASLIRTQLNKSSQEKLERASGLIAENEANIAEFISQDERGKKLPSFIVKVSDALRDERQQFIGEFEDMVTNIDHIKEIVSVQQSIAKGGGVMHSLQPTDVIRDLLTATKGSLTNHNIKIKQLLDPELPEIKSDKHKILQILINLVRNSKDALLEYETENPFIELSVSATKRDLEFRVTDNGIGIAEEKLQSIFQHGYTTKETGHGFGLHSSANTASEISGRLFAHSDGIGQGATFVLRLPLVNNSEYQDADEHNNRATDKQPENAGISPGI